MVGQELPDMRDVAIFDGASNIVALFPFHPHLHNHPHARSAGGRRRQMEGGNLLVRERTNGTALQLLYLDLLLLLCWSLSRRQI